MSSSGRQVLVVDIGGGHVKLGVAGEASPRAVFTNGVGRCKTDKKTYPAHLIDECQDVAALSVRRPVDRGYVVDWGLQAETIQRAVQEVLGCGTRGSHMVVTEPLFNFRALQDIMCQTLFEDLSVASFVAAPAACLALRHHNKSLPRSHPARALQAGLVVDCGYSFAHAVPVLGGQALKAGIKRVNVGGKLITNLMKEMVSYRSVNMMEETFLMDIVKEATAFVSPDVVEDLRRAAKPQTSPHRLEYVLPDGLSNVRGYIRDLEKEKEAARRAEQNGLPAPRPPPEDHILPLNNERFMAAEALFRPADIGMAQAGIAEACVQAASQLPCGQHAPAARLSGDVPGLLWGNVVLAGGVAATPGFVGRFESELRPLVPEDAGLRVEVAGGGEPALAAWRGGSDLGADWSEFRSRAVTKKMYEEYGVDRLMEVWRFQYPYTPNSPANAPGVQAARSIYAEVDD